MWTHSTPNISEFRTRSRSRHLSAQVSIDEQHRFERSDDECFATMYLVSPTLKVKHAKRGEIDADQQAFAEKLSRLTSFYTVDREVAAFILKNTFLFQPLLKAVAPITEVFGETPVLRIELLQEESSRQLFVLIPTKLDAEAAMKKLAQFDKEWWFNVPPEIHNYLEFTLDFV